ncbi:MAG: PTS sugar transporter subunit IIA [Chitinivibrionales bacterium]|nr:PTS sugar transporter subunit IIA [Chitinivibrionales bacterium]
MKLQNILAKNSVLIDIKAADKTDLLTQMGRYLGSVYDLKDSDTIVARILAREGEMSTGIGFGIAIPHARLDSIDRVYLIAARTAGDTEFNAIDEQPVRLVFLMISPANTTTEHTKILSILSRIMSYEDIRKNLLEAPDAGSFLNILIAGEDKYVQ